MRLRLTDPRLLLSLASLVLVLWLFVLNLDRTSPGPLSAPHAREATLVAESSCDVCHGGWGESMAGACTECHAGVGEQIAAERGLHGTLLDVEAEECDVCHREHRGAEFRMVGELGFARAGFSTIAEYDHRGFDFGLVGRHEELDCQVCHMGADVDVVAVGGSRFGGLSQNCTTCHDDPHEGLMQRDCADCHGQTDSFADVSGFVHGDVFPLVGAHEGPACSACHEDSGPTSIESLSRVGARITARSCSDCHDSPHRDEFLIGVGAQLRVAPGNTCVECHGGVEGSFTGSEAAMGVALHAASGFPLDASHSSVACRDCHGEVARDAQRPADVRSRPGQTAKLAEFAFLRRFPGRSPEACSVCHEDPHAGQFSDPEAGECGACHGGSHFDPSTFTVQDHARTSFALTDSHAEVACSRCHVAQPGEAPGARVFRGLSGACEDCHEDAHLGAFDELSRPSTSRLADATGRNHSALEALAVEGCAECHFATSFADVKSSFEHELRTGFELVGAHLRAECESCHPRSPHPDPGGRTFGRVTEVFGSPPEACETCHTDAHLGAFDGRGPNAFAGTSTRCADCHGTESFAEVDPSFEHGTWTGFELEGAHLAASCASCHPSASSPDAHGRRFGRVDEHFGTPPGTCATCHEDPHDEVFAAEHLPLRYEGRESCARCHGTATFSDVPVFDHGLWAGFPLIGAHAGAQCSACHGPDAPAAARGSRASFLGRTLGEQCASCHEDPHAGQFAPRGRAQCADCHRETDSFSDLEFDHASDTRFPLDQLHARLDCAACHRPTPLKGGGTAIRYKPLGTLCADCHGFGDEDERCDRYLQSCSRSSSPARLSGRLRRGELKCE